MDTTSSEIQTVKDRIDAYANRIQDGEDLDPEEDTLEMDVEDGEIWIHPDEDGTTIDIHLFDHTEERDFRPARTRINNHLMRGLDAPRHTQYEPYTPYTSKERMHIRINFEYLQD